MNAADTIIETVLTIFFWVIHIGITVGIALLFGWLLKQLEGFRRRKPVRLLPWALCSFVVLCAVLAALALNPPVVCPDEYKEDLTPEIHAAVQSVSRGIYSKRLPLVPACVSITEIEERVIDGMPREEVHFDIWYLYLGQRGMFWSSVDGYDQITPLFGY